MPPHSCTFICLNIAFSASAQPRNHSRKTKGTPAAAAAHLHLHVSRASYVPLQQQPVITKGGRSLTPRRRNGTRQLRLQATEDQQQHYQQVLSAVQPSSETQGPTCGCAGKGSTVSLVLRCHEQQGAVPTQHGTPTAAAAAAPHPLCCQLHALAPSPRHRLDQQGEAHRLSLSLKPAAAAAVGAGEAVITLFAANCGKLAIQH
jgi:hypothetical protein